MRILIFNTFYFPKFIGGAEVSVQLLAEGLVKEGNQVFVIAFGEKLAVKRVNSVIVITIKQRNLFSSFYTNQKHSVAAKTLLHLLDSFNFFYAFFIKAILIRINPDIIHTNNIAGFSPGLWAAIKSCNVPLVHTIRDYYLICHRTNMFNDNHSCVVPCRDCKFTSKLKANFIKYPDHFVGISNYVLTKHEPIIGNGTPSSVIYNGVKMGKSEIANTFQYPKKINFGYMGRIAPDKGVEYMIKELTACSSSTKKNLKITLAGRGDNHFIDELKNIAIDLELDFAGVVTPSSFYENIDVLIVPSLWPEPFGRTVIEALSFGIPVCISDSGGLSELHDVKSSWLYKPDEAHLTRLIEHIVHNQHNIAEKKVNCFATAQRFNDTRYVNEYSHIYKKMTGFSQPVLVK